MTLNYVAVKSWRQTLVLVQIFLSLSFRESNLAEAQFPRMSLLGSWVNRASPLESARKARPGYGPPDRVSGSQTLEALVEAN
jgi:hypothetical protein